MTSFAFIMGVVPLATAVGASATCRRALGTAVLTGMTTATLVGVILIPCLYVYVQFLLNKMGGDPRKKNQAAQAPAEESPAEPVHESAGPVAKAGKPASAEEVAPEPQASPAPAEPVEKSDAPRPSGSPMSKPKPKRP
jgi:hypothetical protein